jgi:hypothetical protein
MSEGNFKEKEKLVTGPRWPPELKTDWLTDCRSQINFNFNFKTGCVRRQRLWHSKDLQSMWLLFTEDEASYGDQTYRA